MKKILAIVLSLVMVLSLAACGDSDENTTTNVAETGGSDEMSGAEVTGTTSLICSNMDDPGSYGPYGTGGSRLPYMNMLYEPLIYVTLDGEVENVIAKDITDKGDGVYEVTIYDYVHDTEGNPLTASDVVFSFEKAEENGSYAEYLDSIDSIKIIDDYTLEFTLNNEKAGVFTCIASSINLITEAAWEASGDEMAHNAVGTSPYRIADYLEGSYVDFEKTNDYWQTDESLISTMSEANVDNVRWTIIEDSSNAAVAIETGEIDHAMVISASDYGLFMDEDGNALDGYFVDVSISNIMYSLTFNCSDASSCSDINLRKAICYAIDTEAIAENIFQGYGRAVGNDVNPGYADYTENMEHLDTYYPYNVELAEEYLAQSDYNGETIDILVSSNRNFKNAATLIQAYLLAVGIDCNLIQTEAATYDSYLYEETGTEWDLAMTSYQGVSSGDYLWKVLYASDNSLYDFGSLQHIKDDELQSLYETMANEETNSEETVMAFLDYVEKNCYQYGVMLGNKVNVGGSKVQNFVIDGQTNVRIGASTVTPD